jgi:hypothetical protein
VGLEVNGYKYPNTSPTDTTEVRLNNNNLRARNAILCRLTKLQIYKIKRQKIQIYNRQFETLRMNEEENIASYILHVDEVLNSIVVLGE